MTRFVCVLRNCGGLRMSKPYVSVVFFYPVFHRSPCFSYIHFAAFTWNFVYNTFLFIWFINNRPHRLMKTSSIAVETSRSTSQSDSIVRQTNKTFIPDIIAVTNGKWSETLAVTNGKWRDILVVTSNKWSNMLIITNGKWSDIIAVTNGKMKTR